MRRAQSITDDGLSRPPLHVGLRELLCTEQRQRADLDLALQHCLEQRAAVRRRHAARSRRTRRSQPSGSATSRMRPTTARRCRRQCYRARSRSARWRCSAPSSSRRPTCNGGPARRSSAIDRARRIVRTERGDKVGYDTLFLATGGRARGLPGLASHPRIATLRSFEDALAIKAALAAAQRVLVLGGGWIGLEVAASARLQGKDVTVLEAAPRLCVRTVPPCVSDELLRLHESHGSRCGSATRSRASCLPTTA